MNNATNVYGNSRMPLYLQVAAAMRQKIQSQQWALDAQMPTLEQLKDEFRVSRITLRAALDQLEKQGIVRRTRGLGTFVARDLSEERWFRLPGTFDELVRTVADLKVRLLLLDQKDYPLHPAFEFGKVAPAYHRLQRVHFHDDRPYCLIEIFLEKSTYLRDPGSFDTATVLPALAGLSGLTITAGKQIMRVTMSDEITAGHLKIGVGDPVADVCRALLDQHGRIVYYAHIQYPAQMIQIETDLFSAPARSPAGKQRARRTGRQGVPHGH